MTKRQDRTDAKLDQLIEGMGELKTDVAVIKESHRNAEKDREATQKSVELLSGRVLSIERFQSKVAGMATVAGGVITAAVNYFMKRGGA